MKNEENAFLERSGGYVDIGSNMGFGAFDNLMPISGSYIKASRTASRLSLFKRSTLITCSQMILNIPLVCDTSMAFTSIRVSLNGIRSGNFSRWIDTYNSDEIVKWKPQSNLQNQYV